MTREREEIAWIFEFQLSAVVSEHVPIDVAEALLEHVTEWAEERNLQVGGGYHAAREATENGPAYPPEHRAWSFGFGLESEGAGNVPESAARTLLSRLHDWARTRDLAIAGNYKADSDCSEPWPWD